MSEGLLIEHRDSVAVLTLDKPKRMNAMVGADADRLCAALERSAADPDLRAVVITGAGRGFCAGADLSEADLDARRVVREHFNPLTVAIRALDLPVIAAVNGVAAGAGASIALAADLRVLATDARLIFSFVRAGLIPDAGATYLLPRLVGPGRAFEIAALGEPIEAEEALALGLANRVVEADEALGTAIEIATSLAAGPASLPLIKRALNSGLDATLDEQLALEAELQGEAAATEDCAEAISAFKERREPHFRGC
jgi:2-(1,2-epoxy-1,2-dihydrophenyl)acetyl-CoA isomerase